MTEISGRDVKREPEAGVDYRFCVYGDSIAFGYGVDGYSWFDVLTQTESSLKKAQNGEKIADVADKLKQESFSYGVVIIAVGINDLLFPYHSGYSVPFSDLMAKYGTVLDFASAKADKVVVQAVLPVREKLFPKQDWLDCPKQVFNRDIVAFNRNLSFLCRKKGVAYLDAYSVFDGLELSEFYLDAVHLNRAGQEKLCDFYRESGIIGI